jgi:Icc-related predicted phosphoesterase
MKIMIASDIHGSKYYAGEMLKIFHEEKADKLVLLGDLYSAANTYKDEVESIFSASGTALGGYKDDISNNLWGEGGDPDSPKDGSLLGDVSNMVESFKGYIESLWTYDPATGAVTESVFDHLSDAMSTWYGDATTEGSFAYYID